MFLYIFMDELTGEKQQPFFAHSDEEAIRIATMAFAPVPREILHDISVYRVDKYDYSPCPEFSLHCLYRGAEYLIDKDLKND